MWTLIGESLDDFVEEGGSVHLGVSVQEGDVSEFVHSVDGQEHEELALCRAKLTDVDVDVADRGLGEALAL